jgi:hypothetical protein
MTFHSKTIYKVVSGLERFHQSQTASGAGAGGERSQKSLHLRRCNYFLAALDTNLTLWINIMLVFMQKVGQHFKRSLCAALMLLCLKQNRTATTLSSSPSAKHDDWLSEWLSLFSISVCTHAIEERPCLTAQRACLCMYICTAQRTGGKGSFDGPFKLRKSGSLWQIGPLYLQPGSPLSLSDIKTKTRHAALFLAQSRHLWLDSNINLHFVLKESMCTLTLMVKDFARRENALSIIVSK